MKKVVRRRIKKVIKPNMQGTFKTLACKCGMAMDVAYETKTVLCPDCTIKAQLNKFGWPKGSQLTESTDQIKRPAGWDFRKVYVDKAGTVFHKGIEQPKLFDTLKPTVIKPRVRKVKLSKREKSEGFTTISKEISILRKKMNKIVKAGKTHGLKGLTKQVERKYKERKKFL